ncbi:MAG: hypothetical protein OXH99_22155 [Bryobacterales bacterium]|nr:hypothetical protein [Bryobacterales bacterium]
MRFDGDRWRYLPPVPVRRDEVMLDGEEHPAGLPALTMHHPAERTAEPTGLSGGAVGTLISDVK